eukprot:COSAG02_NODE_69_length_42323_cov_23.507850_49_plen_64_part_00
MSLDDNGTPSGSVPHISPISSRLMPLPASSAAGGGVVHAASSARAGRVGGARVQDARWRTGVM